MQSSAALNLAMYLVLKIELADVAEPGVIQNHPVIRHLQKLNSLIQSLEDGIETSAVNLTGQLKKLVQAAALLDGSNIDESNDGGIDESDEEDDSDESNSPHHADITKSDRGLVTNFEENDKDDESSDDETTTRRDVLTEARFGLRQKELLGSTENLNKRHGRNGRMLSYAGDDDDEFDESQHKSISRTLSTTINSIEQRTATRQRNSTPLVEHLDDHDVDDGELRRGLEMMEDELGKASDDEQEMGESQENLDRGDYDTEEDDFYNKISNKSKEQKAARKNIYSVAPKFPRVENEIEGERAINRTILKNRGLVAHKAKINRNPRVKKREQYRKAIIRRKGAVRDVRTDEGHKYGGEGTGIKSGLSRSRKLAH